MRKPVFMGSLWLRARFDVEYLGLPLPSAPAEIAAESMMEADLDYIGATRQDRIIAEQVRREHQVRLEWVGRWLKRFGWTFDELPGYLTRELPYLANRGGEALRALVVACVLDHDDIATLALSIEGLETVLAYAAEPSNDFRHPPAGSPRAGRQPAGALAPRAPRSPPRPPGSSTCRASRATTRPSGGGSPPTSAATAAPSGAGSGSCSARAAPDPWETVRSRMRDVLLRTDLWSDQVLVLRAVQSLTMLDVQHNCELVWDLGGYTAAPEPAATDSDSDDQPADAAVHPESQGVPRFPLAEV